MSPQRIQRRRVKGWRMPAGAVYVGRGAIWGNPFKVGGFYLNRSAFHDWPFPADGPERTRMTASYWTKAPYLEVIANVIDRAHAVDLFRRHVAKENVGVWDLEALRQHLAGKDLACWCPLDQPCHADVLLELANSENVKNLHNQECAG